MGRRAAKLALTDLWYGNELGDVCDRIQDVVEKLPSSSFLRILYQSSAIGKKLTMFLISGRYEMLLVKVDKRLGLLLPLCFSIIRKKKLFVIEFIQKETIWKKPSSLKDFFNAKRLIYRVDEYLLSKFMYQSAMMLHVLTPWEGMAYSKRFGIPLQRFRCIQWPMNSGIIASRLEQPSNSYVFSSGRSDCDWDTLFEAAQNAKWSLFVVCDKLDKDHVDRLNADGRAQVLSEIPQTQHNQLLLEASVYVLCLKERHRSAGQIRLGYCNEAGVPVVATAVRGLESYLFNETNALVVPTGDAVALRAAIEQLIASKEAREQLAARALENSRRFTRKAFMDEFRNLIVNHVSSQ